MTDPLTSLQVVLLAVLVASTLYQWLRVLPQTRRNVREFVEMLDRFELGLLELEFLRDEFQALGEPVEQIDADLLEARGAWEHGHAELRSARRWQRFGQLNAYAVMPALAVVTLVSIRA
jgi:hypothetical protein